MRSCSSVMWMSYLTNVLFGPYSGCWLRLIGPQIDTFDKNNILWINKKIKQYKQKADLPLEYFYAANPCN